VQDPATVGFQLQPDNVSQVACVNFEVHATAVPTHEPIVVASQVQPGVAGHVVALRIEQLVIAGVPTQRGPFLNVSVGAGA
jgi:hypothetical protein